MIRCRFFSGYKPCSKNTQCDESCPSHEEVGRNILIVHLGAIGAVVRSTSLLAAINRKYPRAQIHWLTQKPCDDLLQNNPQVHRVWLNQFSDLQQLKNFIFEAALVIDKDLRATGLLQGLNIRSQFGFAADPISGGILPANSEATELWNIGLSNETKFYINRKTEVQLVHESLALGTYVKDEYQLPLTREETALKEERYKIWSQQGKYTLIGLNTGCSNTLPLKKPSLEAWKKIISALLTSKDMTAWKIQIVLLGGPEDEIQNNVLAAAFPQIIKSLTDRGLRDGLVSVAACDVVLTGDSLGMHMAISQRRPTVAWFGPTCDHEIEFYGRGVAVKSAKSCSPCWNRHCQVVSKCNEEIDVPQMVQACVQMLIKFGQPKAFDSVQLSKSVELDMLNQ